MKFVYDDIISSFYEAQNIYFNIYQISTTQHIRSEQ